MKGVQPYQPLRDQLDAALDVLHEKMTVLQAGINQDAPPILSAGDAHEVNTQIAVVESHINAFTSEYNHMAQLNEDMTRQRDELKRKLESLKRLFNRSIGDDTASDEDDDQSSSGRKKRKK